MFAAINSLLTGGAPEFNFDLTTGSNLNLRTQAIAAGWGGTIKVIATVPSGNTISGTGVSTALTIDGSFPNGVTLVNSGLIQGYTGSTGTTGTAGTNGAAGSGGSGGYGLVN